MILYVMVPNPRRLLICCVDSIESRAWDPCFKVWGSLRPLKEKGYRVPDVWILMKGLPLP